VSFYDVARGVSQFFLKCFFGVKYVGVDNFTKMDPNKGVLLCSNHMSNFDPPAISVGYPGELSFMAKVELFKVPGLKQVITALNAFPVHRGVGDRQALKLAIQIMNDGGSVMMFPEGHRSKNGELGEGQSGVGFLVLKSDAVVVPVAILGRYKIFGKIKVVYGPPIDFSKEREQRYKPAEVTAIIMEHIQRLINEQSDKHR